jgi:hypothetical protein
MIFGLEGLSIEISIIEETTDRIQTNACQQADVVVILAQLS